MGLIQCIAWALGLYESEKHYQKRLNKWNKKQDKKMRLIVSDVLRNLELDGYQEAIDYLEKENSFAEKNKNQVSFPDIDLTIKKMWATKPQIKEKNTGLSYKDYYQKLEQKQKQQEFEEQNKIYQAKNGNLLDKEKEILQLKIKLAQLEKRK